MWNFDAKSTVEKNGQSGIGKTAIICSNNSNDPNNSTVGLDYIQKPGAIGYIPRLSLMSASGTFGMYICTNGIRNISTLLVKKYRQYCPVWLLINPTLSTPICVCRHLFYNRFQYHQKRTFFPRPTPPHQSQTQQSLNHL